MPHLLTAPIAGGVHPRLDINTFLRDDRQFSLYVQALNRMYDTNQADFSSYFQVAGIHGLPFAEWDGASVPGFTVNTTAQWGGYCTHGSMLFPTWHRPYLMLAEGIIHHHAQTIAGTYTTNRGAWQDAASKLRQPYWDWASDIVPPPEVIEFDEVEITVPNGQRQNVTNPLKKYRFHPIEPSFPIPYRNWQTTLRHPENTTDATDNVDELRRVLRNSQQSTTYSTYNMLTRIHDWPSFSSHTVGPGTGSTNSLESIHDNIHVLVGGIGHMSDAAVASFDPIFYLHHANVDRLVSIWSAINPDVWVTPGDAQDGSWTLARNQSIDTNTPLTPFWKSGNTYWSSQDLQNTAALGYTYPEFVGLRMNNKQELRRQIVQKVNAMYGSRSPPIGSEWSARVVFERADVSRSFSVIFFMGDAPENRGDWLTAQNFVGAHHAYLHGIQCTECDKSDAVEEGFVPISPYLADRSNLPSSDRNSTEPLLTQQLKWHVLSTDGQEINVQSLEVTVQETSLDGLSDDILPKPGNVLAVPDITRGRNGGYRGRY